MTEPVREPENVTSPRESALLEQAFVAWEREDRRWSDSLINYLVDRGYGLPDLGYWM